jgi:hypothetical protein
MTTRQIRLCELLKRLGFRKENRIKLYGSRFELVSDPVMKEDTVAFVDAIEQKTRQLRRVRIPMMIIKMAIGRKWY